MTAKSGKTTGVGSDARKGAEMSGDARRGVGVGSDARKGANGKGGLFDSRGKTIVFLVCLLLLVVVGSVLFVGAASGWFDGVKKIAVDKEYYCSQPKCYFELKDIDIEEYEQMAKDGKSFVAMVDQGGCTTADRLREYAEKYSNDRKFVIFRLMFSDIKESSIGEKIKYYPSMAVVSKGEIVSWLRADNDEDAPAYNNYDDFAAWMNERVE